MSEMKPGLKHLTVVTYQRSRREPTRGRRDRIASLSVPPGSHPDDLRLEKHASMAYARTSSSPERSATAGLRPSRGVRRLSMTPSEAGDRIPRSDSRVPLARTSPSQPNRPSPRDLQSAGKRPHAEEPRRHRRDSRGSWWRDREGNTDPSHTMQWRSTPLSPDPGRERVCAPISEPTKPDSIGQRTARISNAQIQMSTTCVISNAGQSSENGSHNRMPYGFVKSSSKWLATAINETSHALNQGSSHERSPQPAAPAAQPLKERTKWHELPSDGT